MTDGPILVTGAGGFVCSEVAVALTHAGHAVIAVDQMFDAPTRARLTDVRMEEGLLPDVLMRLRGLGPRAVIHGAAITASPERLGLSNAAHIRRNVEMHTETLEFAHREAAARFLFLSSMGVFEADDAPAPGGVFTESTRPTATCTYCAAKQAGELITGSAAEVGFATLSLRLGNIFGAHEAVRETRQHLCLVSRMVAEARATGVITVQTPEALREWSWLPDLARGIAQLVDVGIAFDAGMIHAGTPPVISDLDVARAIASHLRGTVVRIAPPPHMALRPPMASHVPSVFDTVAWTSVGDALEQLIRETVAS